MSCIASNAVFTSMEKGTHLIRILVERHAFQMDIKATFEVGYHNDKPSV